MRLKPKKQKPFTINDFMIRFPDDDTCLEHLMRTRFGVKLECPKCKKESKFHRVKKRPVFECQWCAYNINPMAGTPFAKTHTSLQKWFYAMYLFTTSRHGVAGKELQRQLGVTYKTAWRMAHEIRKYMAQIDGNDKLGGHVEVDETFVGGKQHHDENGSAFSKKAIVFGMVERHGKVMTQVITDRKGKTVQPIIKTNIYKGSTISSDDWRGYGYLSLKGFRHKAVNHSEGEYARGVFHTNTIEGFWSRLKNSIKGTHVHVNKKHLSKYLGEFEFRFNLRKNPALMFDLLLASF